VSRKPDLLTQAEFALVFLGSPIARPLLGHLPEIYLSPMHVSAAMIAKAIWIGVAVAGVSVLALASVAVRMRFVGWRLQPQPPPRSAGVPTRSDFPAEDDASLLAWNASLALV